MGDATDAGAATGASKAAGTGQAAGATAGVGGADQKQEKVSWTRDEVNAEADRRVTEAEKKWRKDLAGQLAEKGKDADARIAEIQARLAEAEGRADFVALAVKAGISDIEAAYVVAREFGFFKDGKLDTDKFREKHPAMFGSRPGVSAGAGVAGGGQTLTANEVFNRAIRSAAGVQ